MARFNIIFIVCFILLANLSFASTLHHTNVNFYDDGIDRKLCVQNMNMINSAYFDNVSSIEIYEYSIFKSFYDGKYIWNEQKVILYRGCDMGDLIHELAHHKNKMDGFVVEESGHIGNNPLNYFDSSVFSLAEGEIWQSIN